MPLRWVADGPPESGAWSDGPVTDQLDIVVAPDLCALVPAGEGGVPRMLLAQRPCVEGALGLVLYCGRLLDEERSAADDAERARDRLCWRSSPRSRRAGPASGACTRTTWRSRSTAGYGCSREDDVEQHYRDNRLNAIHEGTHGIQAIDLLGRKVVMDGGVGLDALEALVRARPWPRSAHRGDPDDPHRRCARRRRHIDGPHDYGGRRRLCTSDVTAGHRTAWHGHPVCGGSTNRSNSGGLHCRTGPGR